MDKLTLGRYEEAATDFIDHYSQIKPGRVYELMSTFFKSKGRTLDIGCASGRDLAYMFGAGYEVEGIDAVPAFVQHCRSILKNISIKEGSLPHLECFKGEGLFDNVLMSAVLMHIPAGQLANSVANLLRITKKGGRLVMSVRNQRSSEACDLEREKDGRLYTNISAEKLITLFEAQGGKLLFKEEQAERRREDVTWHNFVFEKIDDQVSSSREKLSKEILEILDAAFDVARRYQFERELQKDIEVFLDTQK